MFWYLLYICKGKIYANFILWGFLTSIQLLMSIFEQYLSQIERKRVFCHTDMKSYFPTRFLYIYVTGT
jgi:hypothetical protein